MTDHAQPVEHDEPHEGPIRTRKALILTLFWAHVVPIFGIILLVIFVVAELRPGSGSTNLSPEATARRIAPVGRVEVKDVSDVGSLKTGEQVFQAQCSACHATGAAGAPKLGDAAAWGPRIATGFDALLHSALKGKGAMTPQGGGDFNDLEIARAVVYMANQGGAKFEEPKAPPAAAATNNAAKADAGADAQAAAAAAQAAMANVAKATTAAAPAAAGAVPALYAQVCQACHAAGVAGAPKLGDKAAWAPRIADGIDGMTAIAIKGKGAMPPRGGSTASDDEIKAVVTYMANAAK